jgi:hypothetical protein
MKINEEKQKFLSRAFKKAGELLDDKPSEQILLTEYQTCQSDVMSLKAHYWITVGIFVGINTALLAMVASSIVSVEKELWGVFISHLVLGLGISVILLLAFLWFWLCRTNLFIRINYARMREIEYELGMQKNLLIHWIEHLNDTPNKYREKVNKLRKIYIRGIHFRGVHCVLSMYSIIGLLWIFFIIATYIWIE